MSCAKFVYWSTHWGFECEQNKVSIRFKLQWKLFSEKESMMPQWWWVEGVVYKCSWVLARCQRRPLTWFFKAYKIAFRRMSQNPFYDHSALVLVMAWLPSSKKPIPEALLTQNPDNPSGRTRLTLYVLNFSEGTKTYIYVLCNSSSLTWHRWLNLPVIRSKHHGCWCPGDTRSQGINNHMIFTMLNPINSVPAR